MLVTVKGDCMTRRYKLWGNLYDSANLSSHVNWLRKAKITVSMTESGDPNENPLTERVIRSLEDFRLNGFATFVAAEAAVEQAIGAYSSKRPYASLNYLTPDQAHARQGCHRLKWYPFKKVRYGNVQYQFDSQFCCPL